MGRERAPADSIMVMESSEVCAAALQLAGPGDGGKIEEDLFVQKEGVCWKLSAFRRERERSQL